MNPILAIVRDLLNGGRHSRDTVSRACGKSLPTADRWLKAIEEEIPGVRRVKVGKTSWIEIGPGRITRARPTRTPRASRP